jgi:hypothetical protein
MLKQLWDRRETRASQFTRDANETTINNGARDIGITTSRQHMAQNDDRQDNFKISQSFVTSPMADSVLGGVPSIENYLLGSFMPGVADFITTDFDPNLGQEYQFMGGFQEWPMNPPEILPRGQI